MGLFRYYKYNANQINAFELLTNLNREYIQRKKSHRKL